MKTSRQLIRKHKKLTEEQKELIWRMFFGPYDKDWIDEDGIVNNSDEDIAKRLNVPKVLVTIYLAVQLENHFNTINDDNTI